MTKNELERLSIGISPLTLNIYFGVLDKDLKHFKHKREITLLDKVNIRMAYEYLRDKDDEFKEILKDDRYDIFKLFETTKKSERIYETNSGLGYQQKAFLLRISKDKYLCIGTQKITNDDIYIIGKVVEVSDSCVKISSYDITNSPLWTDFLFQEFLKNKGVF